MPLQYKRTLYYVPIVAGHVKLDALVDTGAFSSAISLQEFGKLQEQKNVKVVFDVKKITNESVRVANGTVVSIKFRANIQLKFAGQTFVEEFMILEKMNSVILGAPFFEKNNITIDLVNKRLNCPDFTLQLNQVQTATGTVGKVYRKNFFLAVSSGKLTVEPKQQIVLKCSVDHPKNDDEVLCGIIEWYSIERICVLRVPLIKRISRNSFLFEY